MSQSILKIEPYATDNTANFVFNGLTVTSNISSGNANLGNVVTANYYYGNGVNLTGIVTTSANFANYAGNVTVGSQGNITSVGTLSGLTATGIINLTGASNVSLGAVGNVKITGGSSSQYLQTDGTGNLSWATVSLSSAIISNGTSNVSIPASGGNVNISVAGNANVLVTTGSGVNVSGSLNATGNANVGNLGATGVVATTVAGALTTQSQPNVTSVGTLSGLVVNGNTTLIGNLVVTGNTTFVNSNITDLQDPLIQLGTGANGATLGGNLGVDIGAVLNYYNSAAQTAFMGWKTANADFEFVSNATVNSNNVITVNTLGNIRAGNANLGNTVTANYTNAVLTTASQPNITSVGTLASLTVTANITGGNANLGNLVTANYFSGAGNNLSNIQGGNVTGQVGNALVAGTVYTNAQPNITSVGTLTSLTVSGLLTATGTGIKVANIQDSTGTITIATKYGGSAGDVGITGNLTVGTSGTGNITSVNANLGNAVTANYFVGNGQYITSVAAVTAATVTASAQPNITSVGTLANLIVGNSTANTTFGNGTITASGNISFTGANVSLGAVGNIKITGGTAGYFLSTDGNGNLSWGAASGGSGGATASGSNTQIQYNNAGVLGASANLTFNNTSNTLTVDRAVLVNGANLGSNIANIYIGGGSANQILKTDGVGNLSWIAQPSTTITVDTFTGDGTTTAFTLSVTPTNINQTIVNYNGVFQLRTSAYTISGSTITFTEAPLNNSKIEVTTTIGVMSGGGAFTNRTYTGTGSQTAYTVTSGVTASSLLVTENGVVQTPGTDYTVSGSTLTFTTAPTANMTIQIRELAVAVASVSGVPITVQNQGSNLTTTANLFNFTGSGVTATNSGNNVTVTVPGGLSNARAFGFSLVFGG
jgi:hypothetical protein